MAPLTSAKNRIRAVRYNAAASNDMIRVFIVTDTNGGQSVYRWPVVYPATAQEVDALFRKVKTTMSPYSDLGADTDVLNDVLQYCQRLNGLTVAEDQLLTPVADLTSAIHMRIKWGKDIYSHATGSFQVHKKFQNVRGAEARYKHAASILDGFVTQPRLVSDNIIPEPTVDAIRRALNRGVQLFGLMAVMFEDALFI